ncbi:hypothetical protein HAX54_036776 [Datura stramonium]|uniref:Uncharacterized protein n=1 Tax=Datura stramonium TaxID=4076 RepID=A0ABS8RMF5_DATST|nr:hypothetical protein [Datura stramonium]
MASIAPPPTFDVNPHKFNYKPKFTSRLKRSSSSFTSQALSTSHSLSRVSGSTFCCVVGTVPVMVRLLSRCHLLLLRKAHLLLGDGIWRFKMLHSYHATSREDYEDAARLKVAIAAAATKDIVGRVMCHVNKAVEKSAGDAVFMRDCAGTGLVGWWTGTSEDVNDPYGRIRISAEHGRYVASQLASAVEGAPLFEIFLTVDNKGEYRQQAVYLKRKPVQQDLPIPSPKLPGASSNLDTLSPTENKSDMFDKISDSEEDGEDRDDDYGFQNALRDMIPGVQVKVLKVSSSRKVKIEI